MIKKSFSFEKFLICIIILFCFFIIFGWFKDGKLLATGEDGLMLVNPLQVINLYEYSWNEIGFGTAAPVVQLLPLFYLESLITGLGLPVWVFQATIFFFLMVIGSLSVYYLSKELLKYQINDNRIDIVAFVSAIFYILNPVSLLGVWYRSLLVFMFFYGLAPLFFCLYVIGVNNKKHFFIILIPLISLFFTFSFGNPATVLLLWFLPFIYTTCLSLQKSPKRNFITYPLFYFISTSLFWLLVNLWWIFPYIAFSEFAFGSENTPTQAINTLQANSVDFTMPTVIRMIHGGFLYKSEAFGSIYKTLPFIILSWLIPVFTIYGLIKLKRGFIKWFFAVSFILLLYLVKGTSPPFGGIFLWLFKKVTLLYIYRNPLEKIGMILPTVYAPIFGYGLFYLLQKIKNIKKRYIALILSILCLAIFNWPFFTGALVSFGKRDIRVVVPPSFKNSNLAVPAGSHIILSIPVMGGASGFYKWQYGYKGIESSEYLLDYPVITKFYDSTAFSSQILIGLSNGPLNNLVGVAQLFSADIVAYRKDTDVQAFGYNLDALERFKKMIDRYNLVNLFDSPELSLWSLPKEKIVPAIYTPDSVRFGQSAKELISLLENGQFDPKLQVFVCINKNECNPYIETQDLSQIQIDAIPESIEFKKLSPVNYDIKVNNSKGRFILVFNNTYHPGWVASVDGKPIESNRHIVANGYSNGFLIDKTGYFNISLEFTPQTRIVEVYKISLLFILIGSVVMLGLIILAISKYLTTQL